MIRKKRQVARWRPGGLSLVVLLAFLLAGVVGLLEWRSPHSGHASSEKRATQRSQTSPLAPPKSPNRSTTKGVRSSPATKTTTTRAKARSAPTTTSSGIRSSPTTNRGGVFSSGSGVSVPSAEQLQECGRICRKRIYRMPARQINHLLPQLQRLMSYHQRIAQLSRMYLGGRYRFGPLGEGPRGRYDRDPIFRLRQVDCVTYVETVMALALSSSLAQARKVMQRIRYKKGVIRFEQRNHYTFAQWLAENEGAGYLRRITRQVGGKHIRWLHKKISRATWRGTSWGRRIPYALLPKSYSVPYVPLRRVRHIIKKLPAVGWMGEVFDDRSDPASILHVGLVIRYRGTVYFRHANSPRVRQISLLRHTRWRLRRGRVIGYIFAAFLQPPKGPSAP